MSSSTPQSSDIRTTRYTIKANVETTRYFVSPETDIEHQVIENTEDISAIQAQLLLKENITDHDADISAINTALSTKESSTDHATDIANLQNQIAAITPGTAYEGTQKPHMKNSNITSIFTIQHSITITFYIKKF